MRTLSKSRLLMSRPSLVPVSVETDKVCINCGEFVHDEHSCLTCACGIFFAYEIVDVQGNLVLPIIQPPPDE